MTDIPTDIMDVTNKLVNDYVNPDVPRPDYRPTLRKMIAAALLAERHRCKKIADRVAANNKGGGSRAHAAYVVSTEISGYIASGE